MPNHPLAPAQTAALLSLFRAAELAKVRAESYFQAVVDGIVVDGPHKLHLSEDATHVLCLPDPPTE